MCGWKPASIAIGLVGLGLAGSAAATTTKFWKSPFGGTSGAQGNWSPAGAPESADYARFDLSSAYTVTFTDNLSSSRLLIGNDKLVMNLGGFTYDLESTALAAMVMGLKSGDIARLTLRNGTLNDAVAVVGAVAGTRASVTVGPGAAWNNSSLLAIGNSAGSGNLTITRGGHVASGSARVGAAPGSKGTVMVSSANSSWDIAGNLLVGGRNGGGGTGQICLRNGAKVAVAGALNIRKGGTFRLSGGTLTAGSITSAGTFAFVSGTLNLTRSDFTIGIPGPLGAAVHLRSNQTINIVEDARLNATAVLILDDGKFTARQTDNLGEIRLGGPDSLLGGGLLLNEGLLHGTGQVWANVDNAAAGRIQAAASDHLVFAGAVANSGHIDVLAGGTAEFAKPLVNNATGVVTAAGSLVTNAGVSNAGRMSFSFPSAGVIGTVRNLAGGVINITSPAISFLGDVVHNGQDLSVAPTSTVSFAANVTGAGNFTGGGDLIFQGTYSPGNDSPAHVIIDGSVAFAPAADLILDLGSNGIDYLEVTKSIHLANVDIVVRPGFIPQLGAIYTLVSGSPVTYGGPIVVLGMQAQYEILKEEQFLALRVIPEPSTFLFVAAASLLTLSRRRRKQ